MSEEKPAPEGAIPPEVESFGIQGEIVEAEVTPITPYTSAIDADDFSIQISDPKVHVEPIAEKRIRPPKGKKRFERIESGVEGIEIITEHGADPHFSKAKVRRLQADTDRIARFRTRQEMVLIGAKSRLIKATGEQDGFRGIVSSRGNYEAPLVPSETVVYDPELLRESTGEFHQTLIREEGRLTINLPFGTGEYAKEELLKFTASVARLMIEMGRDPEVVGAMITPSIVQRLDEERLNQLIAEGKIRLLPSTKRSTINWATPINPIDKMTTPRRQRDLIPENKTSTS
jgi:hypothetical protein